MPRGLGEPKPHLVAEHDERIVLVNCDIFRRHCDGIVNIPCALNFSTVTVSFAGAVDPRVPNPRLRVDLCSEEPEYTPHNPLSAEGSGAIPEGEAGIDV